MDMISVNDKSSKWIPVFTLLLVAVLGAILLYSLTREQTPEKTYILDDHWNITYQGNKLEQHNLDDVLFTQTKRGDVIELSFDVPNCLNIQYPALSLYSVNSVVEVFLDDKPIYSYGKEAYESGKLVGYGYHFVKLPIDYEGKNIKIRFILSEDDALTSIHQIMVCSMYQIHRHMMVESRVSLANSLFLMVFGIIMLILGGLIRAQKHSIINIFCVAIMSMTIGGWVFCNRDIITLFTDKLIYKVYMEYICLYFFTIPLLGYFYDLVISDRTPKWIKAAYRVLLFCQIGLFVLILILNGTDVLHLPRFLSLEHCLMGLTCVFLMVFLVDRIRRKEKIRIKIVLGFTLAVGFACFELIRYNICRYIVGFRTDGSDKSYIDIAALIIVLTLFWDYFSRASEMIQEEAKRNLLMEMAYKDELTGLANRRKFDDELSDSFASGAAFSVISLDMNFLKKINDTYGHESGDAALRRFANLLKEVFTENAVIGRCGGDEFSVLLQSKDRSFVESKITQLVSAMERENKHHMDHGIPISSAWGVAYSDEADAVHTLLALADTRMYENKRASKLGRDS